MDNIWKWLVIALLTGCGGNYEEQRLSVPVYEGETCMSASAMLLASSNYIVDAADFDGTNDYMSRGASLTGITNGKTGILSFWYRVDAGDGTDRFITFAQGPGGAGASSDSRLRIRHLTDNKIHIIIQNSTNIINLQINTSAIISSAVWNHILASWDLATGVLNLYVNDISDINIVVNTNDTLNYAGAINWFIGSSFTFSNKVNGCLSEFYFAPNQYLDFSIESSRRKFISAPKKPVLLGADGSLPTGVAPIIYHHINKGEAVANFALNRGTGGNFTITGTLDTASTSPSD